MTWRREVGATNDTFLADLSEVRALVEPAGARLAAQRRSEGDLADIGDAREEESCDAEQPEGGDRAGRLPPGI